MISEERASHLAHLIREQLKKNSVVECSDEMMLLQKVKIGVQEFIKVHEEVDKAARLHISSQKKGIAEGSMEWDVLYGRFYEQELTKKGI